MKCWVIGHKSEKGGDYQIEVCETHEKMSERLRLIHKAGNREIFYISAQDILS